MEEDVTKQRPIDELQRQRKRPAAKDISQTRQLDGGGDAAAALRGSHEWFRVLAELLPGVSIIGYGTNGEVLSWNRESEALFGYAAREAIGKNLIDLIVPPELEHVFLNVLERGKATQASGEFMPGGELLLLDKQGRQVPAYSRHVAVISAGQRLLFCVAFGMLGIRQIEKELLNTKKLESIGVLAGGIAHDFNNLLFIILGNLNMAQLKLSQDHTALKHVEEAERACLRAKDLTQKFITFSSGGGPLKSMVPIRDLIGNAVSIVLSGSNVTGQVRMQRNLWKADIDEDQVRQALIGVIVNAREAMPQGGTLRVTAENVEISGTEHLNSIPEGKYVKVVFQDEGVGIPDENLDRIFDPYFSTKSRGVQKGTGFGLTIAHSVIKRHKGQIRVESPAGRGTTVTIFIPASSETAAPSSVAPFHHSGKKRILIMDDEEMLVELLKAMIDHLGYETGIALTGEQAIQMYAEALEQGRDWDALILDLTVKGGMGASETLPKLHYLNPNVKAIVSSGHATDPVMSDYGKHGFRGVLGKPYALEQLKAVLETVLNE